MPGLKLNHVSERGPRSIDVQYVGFQNDTGSGWDVDLYNAT